MSGVGVDAACQTDLARRVAQLSAAQWGTEREMVLIGVDRSMIQAECRLLQFAQAESPVLITGETGTGKELFARALFLLCARRRQPYLSINCAQFQDGHLLVSELFGHKKGSFTGAVADRLGIFEEGDRGVVFLDEIAELPLTAQAMLLRTLSEGEVVRVGESRPRRVNVRIIAATARPLEPLIAAGAFRQDLYFRLRFLRLHVPPVRERGDDWQLMVRYYLQRLNGARGVQKQLSAGALDLLRRHRWPGNVRELRGIVDMGFHLADGDLIEPAHVADELAGGADPAPAGAAAVIRPASPVDRYERMKQREATFWTLVYEPFMDRELNRGEARAIIVRGLRESRGSYKRLLPLLGIDDSEYLRFMDFLRHHRLKPADADQGAIS